MSKYRKTVNCIRHAGHAVNSSFFSSLKFLNEWFLTHD